MPQRDKSKLKTISEKQNSTRFNFKDGKIYLDRACIL